MAWFDPDLKVRNPDFSYVGAEHTLGGQQMIVRRINSGVSHTLLRIIVLVAEKYCMWGKL